MFHGHTARRRVALCNFFRAHTLLWLCLRADAPQVGQEGSAAFATQADHTPNDEHTRRKGASAFCLLSDCADCALPYHLIRLPCCPYHCNLQHAQSLLSLYNMTSRHTNATFHSSQKYPDGAPWLVLM